MSRPSAGLDRVLYIRVDTELHNAVNARWEQEKKVRPGLALSRADIVRELLWMALG